MTELTYRQRKMKLKVQLLETVHARKVWQEKPNTFVKFKVRIPPGKANGAETLETFGFSKCAWPDEWDAEYGIELAEDKAISKAAKIVLERWG